MKNDRRFISYRTIIALGFNISVDKPPARIRTVRLPNEPYLQHNGYKPAPLDLSAVDLNAKMEELVDKLAENTHNVWARERISQVQYTVYLYSNSTYCRIYQYTMYRVAQKQ